MIDIYFKELRNLASSFLENPTEDTGLFLEGSTELDRLIKLRMEFLSDHDIEKSSGYLTIGLFSKYSRRERLACFLILFELENELNAIRVDRICEPYKKSQPIFKKEPSLFNEVRKRDSKLDYELISFENLIQIDDSEIIKYNKSYFKLPSFIDPFILSFSNSNFPDSNIYIRINPFEAFDELPPRRVFEETLIPARPDWWKDLDLHKNSITGSSYILQDSEPTKENYQKYWDYNVKGIRKLEVYAQRNNSGNLSMMLEELSYKNIDSGFILGKMIHLDTNEQRGSSFESANLNHLDLAINIYRNESIVARENANLAKGRIPDACLRTHLFRIEQIPMSILLLYSKIFFDSKALFREWIIDQFT